MKALFPKDRLVTASDIYCRHDYFELQEWLADEGYETVPLSHEHNCETGWFKAKVTKKEPHEMTVLKVVEHKLDIPTIDIETITNADYVGYSTASDYAILTQLGSNISWFGFLYGDEIVKAFVRFEDDGRLINYMRYKSRDRRDSIRKALTSPNVNECPRTLLCSDSLRALIMALKNQTACYAKTSKE